MLYFKRNLPKSARKLLIVLLCESVRILFIPSKKLSFDCVRCQSQFHHFSSLSFAVTHSHLPFQTFNSQRNFSDFFCILNLHLTFLNRIQLFTNKQKRYLHSRKFVALTKLVLFFIYFMSTYY
jgi:hypothetical protein